MASKVVAGGMSDGGNSCWIDEVNGKSKSENFQPKSIKCEINLSQSHGDSICPLEALYVDIFFVFFLTQKSL